MAAHQFHLPSQNRRHAILIGHGVDPFESQLGIAIDGRSAATTRDHDVTGARQVSHHLSFNDANRLWAWREPATVFVGLDCAKALVGVKLGNRPGQCTIFDSGSSMMSVAPASFSAGMRMLICDFGTTVSTA